MQLRLLLVHSLVVAAACLTVAQAIAHRQTPGTAGAFADDLAFLRKHTEVVVLSSASGAQVALAPEYQGRVMTSTTGGKDAPSFGWIGRAAIASRARQPHMNVFGGEDRFWLGPEGGQYALYFKPGEPFDFDHWQVPEPIDWGAWEIATQSQASVRFRKRMTLINYSRARFEMELDRTVRLLTDGEVETQLGLSPGGTVRTVAFESSNTVTNIGSTAWERKSGLVSIWILGQFVPSPETTVVAPFASGPETRLGPVVNDAYFGKVPSDRLKIADGVVLFKADGQYRSKIGLSRSRALSIAGSYDAARPILTLVQYTRPAYARDYVNSMWEMQREPYAGDALNSYNDGPPAPGQPPLGPFYELETSSPALALGPQQRYTHVHRTFHVTGPEADLDRIARATLKVGLAEVKKAFGTPGK